MSRQVRVWEIQDGKLVSVETSMDEAGRKEVEHLEAWLADNPALLGDDLIIIGEQVQTRSGPLDFLAIDSDGNTVIVELKRGRLPREALAQALDYAADVAEWDVDRLDAICTKWREESLDTALSDSFEDIDLEQVSINASQRIILVGSDIDDSLQRMIEWLSDGFGVPVNAVQFTYAKTSGGAELLASSMIIPEELAKERTVRHRKKIEMSDEPGDYEEGELMERLGKYLSQRRETARRLRELMLPMCLEHEIVTRDMLKEELVKRGEAKDEGRAGTIVSTISRELGLRNNDFLRQVVAYHVEEGHRDDYRIRNDNRDYHYRQVVEQVLHSLDSGQ